MGRRPSTVSISAVAPGEPPPPLHCGVELLPPGSLPTPTTRAKTKMEQMERQMVCVCAYQNLGDPDFDEFLTMQPGPEQMGSVSGALLHGCT